MADMLPGPPPSRQLNLSLPFQTTAYTCRNPACRLEFTALRILPHVTEPTDLPRDYHWQHVQPNHCPACGYPIQHQ